MRSLILFSALIVFQGCFGSPALPRKNTPENIEKLAHLGPNDLAEELSGQFEGDMVLTDEQMQELMGPNSKAGRIETRYHWPNGIVYYTFGAGAFNQEQMNYIELGLRNIEAVTCLTFVRRTTQANYVEVNGNPTGGCSANVGQIGGRQNLNLAPNTPGSGCFRIGTIMHEFIHALGFYHMQSATERDTYVKIVWENIEPGKEGNFNTYGADRISDFGVAYDYESVMHYGPTSFSINGQPTIIAIFDPTANMGQRTKLSDKDIQRIRNLYCV